MNVEDLRSARDASRYGGKASGLFALFEKGFRTPVGVAVSAGGIMDDGDARAAADAAAARLTFPLIVRSSATVEDAVSASFAGQFDSVFPVRGADELAAAISKVAHWDERRLEPYLAEYNIPPGEIRMGVVIQEYKEPRWSGVMLTRQGDGNDVIIEAVRGADAVVKGTRTPERLAYALDKGTGGQRTAMPDALVAALQETGRDIVARFSTAQDVEWVFDGRDLWVVQVREVTAGIVARDTVVREELARLRGASGHDMPALDQQGILDGLEQVTPATLGVLRRIYSPEGSLGMILRRYRIPHDGFSGERFIVDAFGRAYFDRTLERRVFFPHVPFDRRSDGTFEVALSFFGAVKGVLKSRAPFRAFWNLLRTLVSTMLMRVDAHRGFNGLRKEIDALRRERPAASAGGRKDIGPTLDRIVERTAPLLFRAALFQKYAFTFLERRLRGRISVGEWQTAISSGDADVMRRRIRECGGDRECLINALGHRGPQELELSRPRWKDDPEKLLRAARELLAADAGRAERLVAQRDRIRESAVERVQGAWDQQMLATFFDMYDRFSLYREELHDVLIQDLSRLRDLLLVRDRQERLNNCIWYAPIDAIMGGSAGADVRRLFVVRRRREALRRVAVRPSADGGDWELLLADEPVRASAARYEGSGVSPGIAEGIAGDLETAADDGGSRIALVRGLEPSITIHFGSVKGVVAETGGFLSHAAIIAREYGLPVVVLPGATALFGGMPIRIDGDTGRIEVKAG